MLHISRWWKNITCRIYFTYGLVQIFVKLEGVLKHFIIMILLFPSLTCLFFSSLCSPFIISLSPGHTQYCRAYYASNRCDQGCNNAACGWDGSDCFREQSPLWAKGTLLLHTKIPKQNLSLAVTPLLWTLSVILQSPLKLRGNISLAANLNLFDIYPQKFADMLAHSSPTDSNG